MFILFPFDSLGHIHLYTGYYSFMKMREKIHIFIVWFGYNHVILSVLDNNRWENYSPPPAGSNATIPTLCCNAGAVFVEC